MQAKITNSLLRSLKPQNRPFEVMDTELPGFLLRVMPSGVMTYSIRYRLPDGRRNRFKIGPASILTPAQARDHAKALLAEVTRGEDPARVRKEVRTHTLKSFLDTEYGPWLKVNRKSGAAIYAVVKTAFQSLADKKLHDISPWLIEKWRASYQQRGVAAATTNRYLGYLRACLNRAVEWGVLSENPMAKVKRSKEDPLAKVRYLTPDEEARLMDALDKRERRIRQERESHNAWCRARGYDEWPDLRNMAFADHLKPMVLLSLHTGMRRGEVFSLEWQDVNLEEAMLTVRGEAAKSGTTRHIPLNEIALGTLQAWKAQTSGTGLVFPSRTGGRLDNVKTSWYALAKAAKVKGFRWHDMRHTFASKLVMAGVDLNTVRELLGHSDIKMTLRYAHLAPQVKAAAVAKLVSNTIPLGGKREEVSIP